MNETDESWMWRAIGVAREAEQLGEVPIGAVIVDAEGCILAAACNRTITDVDPTAHAEIVALRTAAIRVRNYRLPGTTIYTTVEPCAMCAGALVNARVARLVYGTRDERFGAIDTNFGIGVNSLLNHRIEVVGGVLGDKCRSLVQEFFQMRRKKDAPLDASS